MDQLTLLIISAGIVTYVTRRSLFRINDKWLTLRFRKGILYIPIGIFSALILPGIFTMDQRISTNPSYLIGAIFCVVTMRYTKNILLSLVGSVGLVTLISYLEGFI